MSRYDEQARETPARNEEAELLRQRVEDLENENIHLKMALIGFRGGEARLCDQRGNEGAEQGFSSATGIVDELEEAEIGRQLLLRDAAMGT